jgi:hypothetical protein
VFPPAAKNPEQLQFSCHGSGASVCEMPTSSPRVFFTGHATLLFFDRFALPSVPRSISVSPRHSVAWR